MALNAYLREEYPERRINQVVIYKTAIQQGRIAVCTPSLAVLLFYIGSNMLQQSKMQAKSKRPQEPMANTTEPPDLGFYFFHQSARVYLRASAHTIDQRLPRHWARCLCKIVALTHGIHSPLNALRAKHNSLLIGHQLGEHCGVERRWNTIVS